MTFAYILCLSMLEECQGGKAVGLQAGAGSGFLELFLCSARAWVLEWSVSNVEGSIYFFVMIGCGRKF